MLGIETVPFTAFYIILCMVIISCLGAALWIVGEEGEEDEN